MASQDSPFTKENSEFLTALGERFIKSQVKFVIGKIEELFDPNVSFANMLKAKYDALIAAGFSENQAFELALKAVAETLKQATGKVDDQNKKTSNG